MNNIVRKELRRIVDMLSQLEPHCSPFEVNFIQSARVDLVRADYVDFHLNRKKKYFVPKTNFQYKDFKD